MHFQDVQLVAGGGGCASYSCIDHQNFNLFDYLIGIIQTKLCNTKLISNMGDMEKLGHSEILVKLKQEPLNVEILTLVMIN